jgi:Mn2+/Fe2+ NRAMP family transporter
MVGLGVNFPHIDLIQLLVYTSVLNGIVAVPLLYLIGKIARSRHIMGEHASGAASSILLTAALVVMAAAVAGTVLSLG